jgi:hypothetical protein
VLQEREETDQVYTFLAALDSSYEPIQAQILLSTEKLSFDSVTALVRQEATRRVAMVSYMNPKAEAHAFSTHHFGVGKGKVKGRWTSVPTANGKVTREKNVGSFILISDLRGIRTRRCGKGFFPKDLDGGEMEKKGLTSIKSDSDETKPSRSEGERLDRLENLLSSLLSRKSSGLAGLGLCFDLSQIISDDPIAPNPNIVAEIIKNGRSSPKFEKKGAETVASGLGKLNRNNCLTIGLSTKNTSQNYTK